MIPYRPRTSPRRRSQRGFSLIELMVALILGLLVTAAAIGMFLSNSRTYGATQNLGRIQENARIAFELMTRDMREASGNPCSNELEVTNRLTTYTANWWSNWDRAAISRGVVGYNNGGLTGSLAGTDAIELLGGVSAGTMVTNHTPPTFTVNTATHGLVLGDVLMVCDNRLVSIFQAAQVSGTLIGHATGVGVPGNSNANLGLNNTAFVFNDNAMIVRLLATRWFVADNGRGGNSLFRTVLRGNAPQTEEVVEGVQDVQFQYLITGTNDYVDTVAATRWDEVESVRVRLTVIGMDADGSTNNQPLQRTLNHTVVLRNRSI